VFARAASSSELTIAQRDHSKTTSRLQADMEAARTEAVAAQKNFSRSRRATSAASVRTSSIASPCLCSACSSSSRRSVADRRDREAALREVESYRTLLEQEKATVAAQASCWSNFSRSRRATSAASVRTSSIASPCLCSACSSSSPRRPFSRRSTRPRSSTARGRIVPNAPRAGEGDLVRAGRLRLPPSGRARLLVRAFARLVPAPPVAPRGG
jgi:hypothetical protein